MAPEIVQGPNLKRLSTPLPMGYKNISLDSFSSTFNCNHTINFQAKLGEFQHLYAGKTCVLYHNFEKFPTMEGGCPLPHHPHWCQQKQSPTPCTAVVSREGDTPPPPHVQYIT